MDDFREINVSAICEKYFEFTHKSGLKVLVYPIANYFTSHAILGTYYGSTNNYFKTNKETKFNIVPNGIAHFLEHKLFENEDETDTFELYAKMGANANAFTSFDKTCYLFSCSRNLDENLKILLNFVTHPYFTDETVKKEQEIITQEIKMYDDDPNWQLFFNTLKSLYINHPIKKDITGTVDSISEITPDILYKCHNTFYRLNNMALVLTGNVDVDMIDNTVNDILKDYQIVNEVEVIEDKTENEPLKICKKRTELNLPVAIPMLTIGLKEKSSTETENFYKQFEYELLLNILFGETSELYEKLYNNSLITEPIETEILTGDGYMALLISAESKDPNMIYELIINEINKSRKIRIDEEIFEIHKKALFAKYIRTTENPSILAGMLFNIAHLQLTYNDVFNKIMGLTIDNLLSIIDSGLKEEYSVISIIWPSRS